MVSILAIAFLSHQLYFTISFTPLVAFCDTRVHLLVIFINLYPSLLNVIPYSRLFSKSPLTNSDPSLLMIFTT